MCVSVCVCVHAFTPMGLWYVPACASRVWQGSRASADKAGAETMCEYWTSLSGYTPGRHVKIKITDYRREAELCVYLLNSQPQFREACHLIINLFQHSVPTDITVISWLL